MLAAPAGGWLSVAPSTKVEDLLASTLAKLVANDEALLDELWARYPCEHIYLDVGTNIGVQIRKLFEPQKYPKANATHVIYERFFGPIGAQSLGTRCRVCAIGFEPNPHHRARLVELQARYRAAGVGVLVFAAAASDSDGTTQLALGNANKKDPWEDLGASAAESWTAIRRTPTKSDPRREGLLDTVPVRKVDLSRLVHSIHRRLAARSPKGRILMKLDVEGLEFALLPAMIRSQALCTINAMAIEWHTRLWGRDRAERAARTLKLSSPAEVGGRALWTLTQTIRDKVRELVGHGQHDCQTELLEMDDETYMHDSRAGRVWPTEVLCVPLPRVA